MVPHHKLGRTNHRVRCQIILCKQNLSISGISFASSLLPLFFRLPLVESEVEVTVFTDHFTTGSLLTCFKWALMIIHTILFSKEPTSRLNQKPHKIL